MHTKFWLGNLQLTGVDGRLKLQNGYSGNRVGVRELD
jgi:hypothetical protein